jgi:hypothetical protein
MTIWNIATCLPTVKPVSLPALKALNARSLANSHTSAAVRACLGADLLDSRTPALPTDDLMAAAYLMSARRWSPEEMTAVREDRRPLVLPAVKQVLVPSVLPVRPAVMDRLLELVNDVGGIDNALALLAIVGTSP